MSHTAFLISRTCSRAQKELGWKIRKFHCSCLTEEQKQKFSKDPQDTRGGAKNACSHVGIKPGQIYKSTWHTAITSFTFEARFSEGFSAQCATSVLECFGKSGQLLRSKWMPTSSENVGPVVVQNHLENSGPDYSEKQMDFIVQAPDWFLLVNRQQLLG